MSRRRETFECPHCGAEVVVGRAVCRSCGSDDLTGWQSAEELDYQSIEIPDDLGSLDDLERARGSQQRQRRLWSAVALLLVVCFVLWTVLR